MHDERSMLLRRIRERIHRPVPHSASTEGPLRAPLFVGLPVFTGCFLLSFFPPFLSSVQLLLVYIPSRVLTGGRSANVSLTPLLVLSPSIATPHRSSAHLIMLLGLILLVTAIVCDAQFFTKAQKSVPRMGRRSYDQVLLAFSFSPRPLVLLPLLRSP